MFVYAIVREISIRVIVAARPTAIINSVVVYYIIRNNFSTAVVAAEVEIKNHEVFWSFRNVDILFFFSLPAVSSRSIILSSRLSFLDLLFIYILYIHILYIDFYMCYSYMKTELFIFCSNTKICSKKKKQTHKQTNKQNEMKWNVDGDSIFSGTIS